MIFDSINQRFTGIILRHTTAPPPPPPPPPPTPLTPCRARFWAPMTGALPVWGLEQGLEQPLPPACKPFPPTPLHTGSYERAPR